MFLFRSTFITAISFIVLAAVSQLRSVHAAPQFGFPGMQALDVVTAADSFGHRTVDSSVYSTDIGEHKSTSSTASPDPASTADASITSSPSPSSGTSAPDSAKTSSSSTTSAVKTTSGASATTAGLSVALLAGTVTAVFQLL